MPFSKNHGKSLLTYICLISKKIQASKVLKYRWISLVTSIYKIVAKVLAAGLKKALSHTIVSNQSAFVKGRQIEDSILHANELVDD